MKIRFFDHIIVTALTMLLLGVLLWLSFNIKFLSPIAHAVRDFSLSDMYYQIDWDSDRPMEYSSDVVIVDITKLYDRDDIANVIDMVKDCSPKAIGVDVIFEKKSYDEAADALLMEVADSSGAVFAKKLTDYHDDTFNSQVRSFFVSDGVKDGFTNAAGDMSTKCVREFRLMETLDNVPQYSLVSQVAELYDSTATVEDKTLNYRINYRRLEFSVIGCDDVYENRELLKDKLVLIGMMSEESDMHLTPLGKIPGLKILAYSIQTVLEKKNIKTIDDGSLMALSVIICFITVLWQFYWIRFIGSRKSFMGVLLSNSTLFSSFLTFIWLALIAWITYVVYEKYDYNIPMAMILAPVVLVAEGRNLYSAIVKAYTKTRYGSIFENSLYK